ncbi:iron ABC transporter substrate-binding protein [Patulibacter defluvii]|uniref:iron ABC transporter substrate-binding protein n=1 Tax=Patulibacter defluvii TaxID=3095358 RepID=UPI002A748C44|nr:iron ABC transporter substrate-binding protein [Patulibacter sp. DM4]
MTHASRRALALLALLPLGLGLAACGGGDDAAKDDGTLTVYSGRQEKLVKPLLDRFEKRQGIKLEVRYGDSAELAATIAEEGDKSPADAFFSQDAGALGALEEQLEPLPGGAWKQVDERFRDPRGRWTGVSARARVIAYSTKRMKEAQVPDSVFELTDPKWKGKVGLPPSNASFQAFVSGMRLAVGDERTKQWLEAMKRNDAQTFENNIQTEEAIARGEIELGLVNHYYVYELRHEQPNFPVANHFLKPRDPGSLVNAAGIGILKTADSQAAARKLVDFLLSKEAQTYFREQTGEYPLAAGVTPEPDLPPLSDIQAPDVRLSQLGEQLPSTLELLSETGFTT